MPLALGFGIARPEHVAQVGAYADAAVVGSAPERTRKPDLLIRGWMLYPFCYGRNGAAVERPRPGNGTRRCSAWGCRRGEPPPRCPARRRVVGGRVSGLLLSARSNGGELPAPVAYGMHDYLTWLSLGFTGLHVFILLLDKYIPYTLGSVLIPLASPYEPLWVGAGQVGLYLSLIVTVSIHDKKRAQRLWRALHYASFIAFLLITLHGLNSGSDSKLFVMQAVYGLSLAGVVGLTLYRIVAARRHRAGS